VDQLGMRKLCRLGVAPGAGTEGMGGRPTERWRPSVAAAPGLLCSLVPAVDVVEDEARCPRGV
jgi:hypothetical protein